MKKINFKKPAFFLAFIASLGLSSFTFYAVDKKITKAVPSVRSVKPAKAKKAVLAFKNIEFDFNRSSIRKSSYEQLDQVIKAMEENKASLRIAGHADSKGTYLYNWHLSQRRAQSVKDYLVKNGADESRIAATEFGDTKPVASNDTPAGRQKNRRAELAAF